MIFLPNEDVWEYAITKIDDYSNSSYEVVLKKFVVEHEDLMEKDPDKFKSLLDRKIKQIELHIEKKAIEKREKQEREAEKERLESLTGIVEGISIVDENPSKVKDNAFDCINGLDLDNASKRKLKNFVTGKMNLSRKDPVRFEELFKEKLSDILVDLNKPPLRWEKRDDGSLFVSVKSRSIDYATYHFKVFTIVFNDGKEYSYSNGPRKVFERFVYITDEGRRYNFFKQNIHRKYSFVDDEYY